MLLVVVGDIALVFPNKCIAFIFSIVQPTVKIWSQMLRVILPI